MFYSFNTENNKIGKKYYYITPEKTFNGKSFPVFMACKLHSKLVNLPFVGNYR